jgi:TRAP-type uncharacterized transport system fused permease subunit
MKGLTHVEKTRKVIVQGIHYLLPIVFLFYLLLVVRLSPTYCGLVTILLTVVINQIRKNTRLKWKEIYAVFADGTKMCAELTALIAVIGVVQQAFTITGLGHSLSEMIVNIGGGSSALVLFFSMVIAVILGMGLPTPIAYLLSGIFVAPALVQMGFPELGAHLFLFFFAIKSGSTPPIAVVAVVAAGIAQANWWKTAWKSFIYSLPGFFIAFAFILYPAYLMDGTWSEILKAIVSGLIAVSGLSFAMQRHLFMPLPPIKFVFLFGGAITLIIGQAPAYLLIGIICVLAVALSQLNNHRKMNPA